MSWQTTAGGKTQRQKRAPFPQEKGVRCDYIRELKGPVGRQSSQGGPGHCAQGLPGGVVLCTRDLLKDHSKYSSSLSSVEGGIKKDCFLQVCVPGMFPGDG